MDTLASDNLTCGYTSRLVLDRLSLSVRDLEVLVLLGPNGSGKTTLLRSLGRLLRPTGGRVLLGASDLWRLSPEVVARQVALMPQSERRDWPLTVEEAVSLGRTPHRGWLGSYNKSDRDAVSLALTHTGLDQLRERPITELSGGEWRRVILARSLAQEARVLLLDEPTSGLDLRYQFEVLRLIRQMTRQAQLTVVLTLHDLNLAGIYADRIALLSPSRLIALGHPAEVLTPELVEQAFGIKVTVIPHPVYTTPLVVPLPEDTLGCG